MSVSQLDQLCKSQREQPQNEIFMEFKRDLLYKSRYVRKERNTKSARSMTDTGMSDFAHKILGLCDDEKFKKKKDFYVQRTTQTQTDSLQFTAEIQATRLHC